MDLLERMKMNREKDGAKLSAEREERRNPPSAQPCPKCVCPIFWVDPYDGVHCQNCEPPPRPSMVRSRHIVVGQIGNPGEYVEVSAQESRPRQADV